MVTVAVAEATGCSVGVVVTAAGCVGYALGTVAGVVIVAGVVFVAGVGVGTCVGAPG
ncbi:MAG: hypothetical protein WAW52_11905 [Methanothrix sp.]